MKIWCTISLLTVAKPLSSDSHAASGRLENLGSVGVYRAGLAD